MTIPKVFHRIWLGNLPMPDEYIDFGKGWLRLHPGWSMTLWTDANMPSLVNQEAFATAPSFAAKADILRYEIMLRHGGVYIDTDFECLRCIEPLLEGIECFVGQQRVIETDFGGFAYCNNAIIGAVPGHQFLRALVETLRGHMKSLPENVSAALMTGPHFMTTILYEFPEVTVFPTRFFYPYSPIERWRRNERFTDAYAVHHWTLSDVATNRLPRRKMADGNGPCVSVVLHPVTTLNELRLRWVLEGLLLQTATDFEVLVMTKGEDAVIGRLCEEFSGRLSLRYLPQAEDGDGGVSSPRLRNLALGLARAGRILFLDADCLPDPDVVEAHARHAHRMVLLFGYRRVYPRSRLFPYRDAVDFSGLIMNAAPEVENLSISPSSNQWQGVASFCFSVPKTAALQLGGFNETMVEGEVRDLARRLSRVRCPSAPSLYGARVTQMGSAELTSRQLTGVQRLKGNRR